VFLASALLAGGVYLTFDRYEKYQAVQVLKARTLQKMVGASLCWRAVVPLHLRGFSTQLIESLVKLPRTLTETTRSQHRSTATNYYSTVESAQDIITFYQELLDADASEVMLSGRKKHEIAESLAKGDFIPATGMSEDLVVIEYGKEKFISFDHLYFRQQKTVNGLNWELLNEQSHQQYKSNYHV
jgi:hypothetical protein